MTHLKTAGLFVALSFLSACGAQVVEFGIDAGSSGNDGGPGDAGAAPTVTTTLPESNATGVSFGTVINATFSRAMDAATVTNATTFTVKQGATPVAGVVTYVASNNTAIFSPAAPLGASLIYTATITTAAKDPAGRALVADYVWSFTTAATAAPPTVTGVTPLDLAMNVAVNVRPTATFSKAMDPATIITSFTLAQGATAITGAVTLDGATNTATFAPAAPLTNGLVYTATITTGAKDTGGLSLAANFVWTFTITAAGAPPTVSSVTPLNLAMNVALNVRPTATFSKAMDPLTLTMATFTLTQGATAITGAVAYDAVTNTATFTPAGPLTNGLVYTATITTGAKDTGGVALAANFVWTFTTATAAMPPTVTAVTPLNMAMNVPLNVRPTATFSKAMDPLTISTLTFTLKQGLTTVSGAVALNGPTNTATFTPAAPLTNGLVYTATITTGARDTGGLALAMNFVWTFTTASAPPTVTSVTPLNNAMNVSVNVHPTATFSKAMDPLTITSLTFTLKQGVNAVAGAVSYVVSTRTATFTPSAALNVGQVYTATISTGAKDTGGLALAAPFTWSFTTGACSMASVNLASLITFAVLAGPTVTNTGATTLITGDVGTSPGAAIIGLTPGQVIGNIHPGDAVSATAMADFTPAYNDLAGRSLCAVTVAGNIGGQTLTPGLYFSTSSLSISSGDLTLDAQGDADAVFIFQMASTLTTTSGRQVILAGGARAKNIYWQVGTAATLGTTSVFKGTILADQAVSLLTGATLDGRAMARTAAVTLDSNIVTLP